MAKCQVAGRTSTGREVRLNLATGKYEVQPADDNYWLECDTLADAFAVARRHDHVPTDSYGGSRPVYCRVCNRKLS